MSTKFEVTFAEIEAEADVQNPRIDVTQVAPRAIAVAVEPRAEIIHTNLRTLLSFVNAQFSVAYVALSATDITLDPFFVFRRLADFVSFTDTVSFHTYPAPADVQVLVDALAHSTSKVLADYYFFADAIEVFWSPIRAFDETLLVTDALAKAVDMPFSDIFAVADLISILQGPTYEETVTVSDNRVTSFAKNPSETLTMSEALAQSVAKLLTETATLTDAAAKALSKPFADTLTASDAYTESFAKALSEALTPSDAKVLDVGKVLAETLTMSDNLSLLNLSIKSSIPNVSTLGEFTFNL